MQVVLHTGGMHAGPSLFLCVPHLQYVDLFLANGGEFSRYALQSNLLDGHWLMCLGERGSRV